MYTLNCDGSPDYLNIRLASVGDLDKVYFIEERSFPKTDLYPKELLRLYLTLSPKTFLVAEYLGEIIGYALAVVRRGRIGHILSVAVDPNFRRKGTGKKLILKIEEILESLGCIILRLEVNEMNMAARTLYLNLGFKEAYIIPNYYSDGSFSAIVMFKLLKQTHLQMST
ncbi:MAG: N-acetyltransferase [Nitrososphaeria archaeon]